MSTKGLFLLLACLAASPAGTAAAGTTETTANNTNPPPRHLNLASALQLALQRNFSLRVQAYQPQIAAEAVREASAVFDPTLRSESQYQWSQSDLAPDDAQSVTTSFSFGSRLPWSTQWSISAETTEARDAAGLLPDSIGQQAQTSLAFTVVQPLLRDAGRSAAMAGVEAARSREQAARLRFADEVRSVVQQVVDRYFDLHYAAQSLAITQRNRDLAARLLEDNRRRVDKGVMAPADALKAEAELALREAPVHAARFQLHKARNDLLRLLWDDPDSVYSADFSFAEPPSPPPPQPDRQADLARALRHLPALGAAEAELQARQIRLRQLANEARPRMDLVATIASGARDAHAFGSSFSKALDRQQSGYSVGAVFSLPLFNHARNARKTSALLQRNRAQTALRQLEQEVRLNLDNAIARLHAAHQQKLASASARSLINQSLQAEEQRLAAGASSTFVVLRLQADLADARIRELNAASAFARAHSAYLRASAQLLPTYQITIP